MDAKDVFMNQEMDMSNSLENMLVCSESSQQDHQNKLLKKPQQDQPLLFMDAKDLFMNQEMNTSNSLENMLVCSQSWQQDHQNKLLQKMQQDDLEKSLHKPRKPQQDQQQPKCPRCDSTNTKFCYYNNHNLTQPRYFCKSCRGYWTKASSFKKIPVGGDVAS